MSQEASTNFDRLYGWYQTAKKDFDYGYGGEAESIRAYSCVGAVVLQRQEGQAFFRDWFSGLMNTQSYKEALSVFHAQVKADEKQIGRMFGVDTEDKSRKISVGTEIIMIMRNDWDKVWADGFVAEVGIEDRIAFSGIQQLAAEVDAHIVAERCKS